MELIEILFNPYSAGIDVRRQNLTSVDVRFWRLKSILARVKNIYSRRPITQLFKWGGKS